MLRPKKGSKLNALLAHSRLLYMKLMTSISSQALVGPLHGIPVNIKDQAETKGITTTYGSIVARDNVQLEDSTSVKKLRQAGAVILAKSTLPRKTINLISSQSPKLRH